MITSCGKFVPMQSIKIYGELEVQLHKILASSTRNINSSRPIRFIPEEYLKVSVLIPTSNYEKISSQSTRNNYNNGVKYHNESKISQ